MRAERRHHRARLKKKRRHHWGRDLINEPKVLSRAINTPTPCSCHMCGNPRKFFKQVTRQELVQEPLGPEFEQILYENLWDLYGS